MLALQLSLPRNCAPLMFVEIAGFDSLGVFISLTYLHVLNIIFIFIFFFSSSPLPLCLFALGLSVSFSVFLSSPSRVVEGRTDRRKRPRGGHSSGSWPVTLHFS